MTQEEFIEAMKEWRIRYDAWIFSDPKKKKCLRADRKRPKRLFTKKQKL